MRGYRLGLLLVAAMLLSVPARALTSEEKLATCNFGADHQHLQGEARKAFIARCMADEDRRLPRNPPGRQ